jgi:hypothetical protein
MIDNLIIGTFDQKRTALIRLLKESDSKIDLIVEVLSKKKTLYEKGDGKKREKSSYKTVFELCDDEEKNLRHKIVRLDVAIERPL